MGRVRRTPISVEEKAELWARWRRGESLTAIAGALDRGRGALYPVVAAHGGIPPPPPWTRSRRALRAGEREEISRGLARSESLRQIGRRLGRAPSTVSREVRRHGGRPTIVRRARTPVRGPGPAGPSRAASRSPRRSARG